MDTKENIEVKEKFWHKIRHVIKGHKWYVLVILVLLVFVVKGCSSSTATTQTATTETYTVKLGNIENSLKLIGTTKITNMQTLVFGTEGKVAKIYVKEGDKVKAGQLLAELDKKQLNISLSQQSLSVQNARINYDKLITQYKPSDILSAQSNVANAQTKLNVAKNDLATLQAQQGGVVQISSANIQDILITAKNIFNDGTNILNTLDGMFYITKSDASNANAQINLSAKNSSYKDMATTQYYTAKNKLGILQSAISSVQGQASAPLTTIQDLDTKSNDFLSALYTTLDSAVNAVNSSVDGADLSLSTISSWASSLSSSRSKTLSYQSTVNANISALANNKDDIATKQAEVKNDEAQLAAYQQTLSDMQAGPDSNTKTLQLNSIKQSQLSLAQTSQQKDNYEIIAPFDGTIDTIGFKVGDTVSYNAGSSADGITMSNPDAYEVDMLIDQIDIVKVSPGQNVEITFDAYPGYTITGTIGSIDPTPVTSAGVVSYQAKINLTKTDKKIYDSMSANIKVILDHKDNILILPTAAIQTSGDINFVRTKSGSASISVGITDGANTEILSGLQEGDIVSAQAYQVQSTSTAGVTSFQQNNRSGAASAASSFRMMNAAGGGGPGN